MGNTKRRQIVISVMRVHQAETEIIEHRQCVNLHCRYHYPHNSSHFEVAVHMHTSQCYYVPWILCILKSVHRRSKESALILWEVRKESVQVALVQRFHTSSQVITIPVLFIYLTCTPPFKYFQRRVLSLRTNLKLFSLFAKFLFSRIGKNNRSTMNDDTTVFEATKCNKMQQYTATLEGETSRTERLAYFLAVHNVCSSAVSIFLIDHLHSNLRTLQRRNSLLRC